MKKPLSIATDLALRAGAVALKGLGCAKEIRHKGAIDLVTDCDRRCEEIIVSALREEFPDDAILAEEGSGTKGESGNRWIIDPIDGTVNFAHGFPFFCVSIAYEKNGVLETGVIFDPNSNELFSAERGKGAFLNGKKIAVSKVSFLKEALLATGFAYNVQEEERFDNLDHFKNFIKTAQAVRRPGSAAIDLAWVAAGRIDGFWELFLKPWDIAAGVLLVREAGGLVTSFDGSRFDLYGTEVLTSNRRIHEEMIKTLSLVENL